MSQAERLRRRVISSADHALARQHYVVPVEILVDLQWLAPRALAEWRRGQVPMLERAVQANLSKISDAMRILRGWAADKGLRPSETAYVSRTRDRRPLRFSISGNPEIERAYRTHWVSPELRAREEQRLREKLSRPPDLVVIAALNPEWQCSECGEVAPTDFLLMEGPGPLCLTCADLDRLVFLPAGDAALTRRSVKASTLHAVVVRFSRARKRYERQGVLVQENALEQAESEVSGGRGASRSPGRARG